MEISHEANRQNWRFPYTAATLEKAARKKAEHHGARLKWWSDKRNSVRETIKAEGLEFDESLADIASNSSYSRQPSVGVRTDLLNDLRECNSKVREHDGKKNDYDAWVEVLSAQGTTAFELNVTDWIYFFSKR